MNPTIRRLAFTSILLAPIPAWAYDFYDEASGSDPPFWRANTVGMSINTISFPLNGTLHGPVNDMIEIWDDDEIPGSALGISAGTTGSSAPVSDNDGVNMAVGIDMGTCEPGAVAETDYRIPPYILGWGGDFEEADILYNSNCTFTTEEYFDIFDDIRAANFWDIRQVTIHETGHVVGLDHEFGWYDLGSSIGAGGVCCFPEIYDYSGFPTVMEAWASGGPFISDDGYLNREYGVSEDDRAGLRVLYPAGASGNLSDHDLAVSSYFTPDEDTIAIGFKGTYCHEAVGERSRPDPRVDIFEIAVDQGHAYGTCPDDYLDVPPPEYTPPFATPLNVLHGAEISAIFSLLNLGIFDEDPLFRVLMTQTIGATCPSSTCFVVEDASPGVDPNTPYERTTTFEVPSDAPEGEYYLVAEIDYDDDISERDEFNNMAVWNRKIEVVDACDCTSVASSPAGAGSLWAIGLMALVLVLRRRAT